MFREPPEAAEEYAAPGVSPGWAAANDKARVAGERNGAYYSFALFEGFKTIDT